MKNLRISTMTAIGRLFTNTIKLNNIYDYIDIDDVIRYVKYNKTDKGHDPKKEKNKTRKNQKQKKDFFNQMTLHVYDGVKKNNRHVNVKIFNNGKIQMTGIINNDQGSNILNILYNKLLKLDIIQLVPIDDNKLEIALINSDFNYGKTINRDRLYQYLIHQNIFVTYESCIYPGVKIGYYYKEGNKTGICNCATPCNGKGDGINSCRRVTIAVFHSGNIIITGGRSFDQLEQTYNFINKTLDSIFKTI
uniref:TATA-box binding protein n=1 Tax=viral metagenome TaxID=1070528 RepID=A0A6C0CYZ8_9ZZZZ